MYKKIKRENHKHFINMQKGRYDDKMFSRLRKACERVKFISCICKKKSFTYLEEMP